MRPYNKLRCRNVIAAIFLSLFAAGELSADTFRLYVGDMKTLNVGKTTRVAVGNGQLLSTSILENGYLLVLAEKEGDTELQVWLEDGQHLTHKFYITKADSTRTSAEAVSTLKNVPLIKTRRVGKNIVIEGVTNEITSKMIETVTSKYPDIINLTVKFNLDEIIKLVQQVPGLDVEIKKVGNFAIVSGSVDGKGKKAIEVIKGLFPEIVDLTQENKVAMEPMVYMRVQITEFNTAALEKLGIDWTTSFAGPALGYAKDFATTGNRPSSAFDNQSGDPKLEVPGFVAGDAAGFFGIATLITSAINLAVSSGDALILASPTLSAKSGGKAEFLSGGQVPIPVPGPNLTTTIEFKDFGISLSIEPRAGVDGNITAKIKTEVSSLDQSLAFGNVPGFRTRSAETEVSLRDGETLVISGLVNHDIGSDTSEVKWLGRIPILGHLFKSTNFRNNRSDLVVFITPHIIDANSEINRLAIAEGNRLREQFLQSVNEDADILD